MHTNGETFLIKLLGGLFMRSKKLWSLVLAGTLAASMLWGCGAPSAGSKTTEAGSSKDTSAQQSAAGGDQTLRVTVQAWMMGKYDFERIAKEFKTENPGVKVVYSQVDNVDVTSSMLEWSQGKTKFAGNMSKFMTTIDLGSGMKK